MATRSSDSASRPPAWPDADDQRRTILAQQQCLQLLPVAASKSRGQVCCHHPVAGDAPPMQGLRGQSARIDGFAAKRRRTR
jgi:hypothetical protein